jgi:hypothetical protein
MKKELIGIITFMSSLFLSCNLLQDPTKDPANAFAKFITINDQMPGQLIEIKAGVEVIAGFKLFLPYFIDSIKVSILSLQKEIEAQYPMKSPWNDEDLTIPVIFPKPGTKTALLTCFKNNGTT